MSHIPAAAMPHAKPHEHADDTESAVQIDRRSARGWSVAAAVAGGLAVLGAGLAIVAPLIRGRSAPKKVRRERRARKPRAKA